MLKLKRLAPPAAEVLTLDEAKAQLRVTWTYEDALIAAKLAAARELCEAEVARSFVATTWTMALECFPGQTLDPRRPLWTYERPTAGELAALGFPRAAVTSVEAVRYLSPSGATTTLSPSAYDFQGGDAATLAPAYGTNWPAVRARPGSVQVDFTAGYGPDATYVPDAVKEAVRVTLGSLYANRGDAAAELPALARALLAVEGWGSYG